MLPPPLLKGGAITHQRLLRPGQNPGEDTQPLGLLRARGSSFLSAFLIWAEFPAGEQGLSWPHSCVSSSPSRAHFSAMKLVLQMGVLRVSSQLEQLYKKILINPSGNVFRSTFSPPIHM